MFTLLEIEKTVVEGAGAVGLAAVRTSPEKFAGRKTVLVLSGGNVDTIFAGTTSTGPTWLKVRSI